MLEGSLPLYQVPQSVLSSHPISMATPIIAQTKNESHRYRVSVPLPTALRSFHKGCIGEFEV